MKHGEIKLCDSRRLILSVISPTSHFVLRRRRKFLTFAPEDRSKKFADVNRMVTSELRPRNAGHITGLRASQLSYEPVLCFANLFYANNSSHYTTFFLFVKTIFKNYSKLMQSAKCRKDFYTFFCIVFTKKGERGKNQVKRMIKVRALTLDNHRKVELSWGGNISPIKIASHLEQPLYPAASREFAVLIVLPEASGIFLWMEQTSAEESTWP